VLQGLGGALVALLAAQAQGGLALAPGDVAPAVHGADILGQPVRVDYGSTNYTLVNFWSTWCEPCKMEMPALQKLHEEHANDGLQVIGVLYDSARDEEMGEFLDSLGVTYTVIRPHTGVVPSWGGVGSLPTTFLVDGEGTIRRRYVGATPPQLEGMVGDVQNALVGKPLEPLVLPEEPSAVTIRDRPKPSQP
jgi:thiol-disulfide isomerase/thioredoxin